MKIIFTICSNNYLAQAKALGDSVLLTNPTYKFFIGLVDQLSSDINYSEDIGHPIILCSEIGIPDFDSLWKKFNIIELNTCVKPFYFEYFTKNYSELTYLMYFDPDTFVFGDLNEIESELTFENEILVTPHILTPLPLDGKSPAENLFLNYGIYNLGFLAVKNPKNNTDFFKWWGERTYNQGFVNVEQGFFVDQLWINLIPIYNDNVIVSKHYGLNMAPWNLHERFLSKNLGQKWIVNENTNLIFYHFSSFYYNKPDNIASSYGRYSFSTRKDLINLYSEYRNVLLKNNVDKISKLVCGYVEMRNEILRCVVNKKDEQFSEPNLTTRIKKKIANFFKR